MVGSRGFWFTTAFVRLIVVGFQRTARQTGTKVKIIIPKIEFACENVSHNDLFN
jgi:hypothetical protein